MQKRIIAATTVVICLCGLARIASAEDDSGKFRPFNGLFADLFNDDDPQPQPKRHPLQHDYESGDGVQYYSAASNRPKQVTTRPSDAQPLPLAELPADPPRSADSGVIARPPAAAPSQHTVSSGKYAFQWSDGAVLPPPSPIENSPAVVNPVVTASKPGLTGMPLHERLKQYSQSPFGGESDTTSTLPEAPSAAQLESPAASAVSPATSPASDARIERHDPLPAPPPLEVPSSSPVVAAASPVHSEQQPLTVGQPSVSSEPRPLTTAAPVAEPAQEPSVLVNRKSPVLSVETIGPRKIVVGKEAAFEVVLQNSGEQAAEEVAVTVGLPDWAEVAGASASTGEVLAAASDRAAPCRWMLRRIEAHSKEKLALKIVPKQSKPFELAVHWDFKQATSQAMIEVQEPKLTMRLDGPREVFFGKKELYRLTLGNSGNGAAENVTLTLMPLTGGEAQPVTHKLGTLAAGDQRTIEVELTARQSGKIAIRVEANGDGGAHVELAENVLVHRGALQVEIDGPAVQFVGTPAAYSLVVHNPGDAPARNVRVTAKLPTGMKFISGSDGAKADSAADGGRVQWSLERLEPGDRRTLQMKCTLSMSGPNRVEIASTADDELVASAAAVTRARPWPTSAWRSRNRTDRCRWARWPRTNCTFATAARKRRRMSTC